MIILWHQKSLVWKRNMHHLWTKKCHEPECTKRLVMNRSGNLKVDNKLKPWKTLSRWFYFQWTPRETLNLCQSCLFLISLEHWKVSIVVSLVYRYPLRVIEELYCIWVLLKKTKKEYSHFTRTSRNGLLLHKVDNFCSFHNPRWKLVG